VSALFKHKQFDLPTEDDGEHKQRQRAKYTDDYKSKRSSYHVNGFKRAILMGLVPQKASEDHHFLSELFEEAGIEFSDWNWVCDIKVIVAMVGVQSCSSKYPNPFCLWPKGDPGAVFPLRTYEHIREKAQAWQSSGKSRKHLKYYYSCERAPISGLPEAGLVATQFRVPTMHVMIGVVNKIVDTSEDTVPEVRLNRFTVK